MEYLEAAVRLRKFINEVNKASTKKKVSVENYVSLLIVKQEGGAIEYLPLEPYTNETVQAYLLEHPDVKSFVISDVATMDVQGTQLTYLLLKGYCTEIEKGMVFYQLLEPETGAPKDGLQFSNLEDNIFYDVISPDFEESSCNAMERGKQDKEFQDIVFLIGNMDEDRLNWDIQRLIFDTIHNVQKHEKLKFKFHVSISRYGKASSPFLKEQVDAVFQYTNAIVTPMYPNSTFTYEFEN